MGLFDFVRKAFRMPVHNPNADPFAFTFTSGKDGNTEKWNTPVGLYNVRARAKDGRVYDILNIAGHGRTSNFFVKEGDNREQLIRIKAPTFDYWIDPNGKLDIEWCRNPSYGFRVEQKIKINIDFPQKMPVTTFPNWSLLFKSKPRPYSDFNIYIKPTENVRGGSVIQVQNRPIPTYFPNAGSPRLGITDGSRGYRINAVFTDEELRDVQIGAYAIMAKVNFNHIDQHIEIGTIEFTQGKEIYMNIEIVKNSPSGDAISADGQSFAEYYVKATYLDEANNRRRPDGMFGQIETSHVVPLTDTANHVLISGPAPGVGGPYNPGTPYPHGIERFDQNQGNTYLLPIINGNSQPFRVRSGVAVGELTLTAEMSGAQPSMQTLKIGGFTIEKILPKSDENTIVAGLQGRLEIRVKVVDSVSKQPIKTQGQNRPQVRFRVDEHMANFVFPNAPPSHDVPVQIENDGLASVVLTDKGVVGSANVVVALPGITGATELKFQVNIVHPHLEIEVIEPVVANETKVIVAGVGADLPIKVRIKVKDIINQSVTAFMQNHPQVRFSVLEQIALLRSGNGNPIDNVIVPLEGDDTASVHLITGLKSVPQGFVTVSLPSNTQEEKPLKLIPFKIVHPVVKILNVFGEHQHDPLSSHSIDTSNLRKPLPSPPLRGFNFQGKQQYGFRLGATYTITAQLQSPNEGDTNVASDGNPIMFSLERENSIGTFKEHNGYPLLNSNYGVVNHADTDVIVRIKNGVAKVDIRVLTEFNQDKFFVIYAMLPNATNADAILISIVGANQETNKLKKEINKNLNDWLSCEGLQEDANNANDHILFWHAEKSVRLLKNLKGNLSKIQSSINNTSITQILRNIEITLTMWSDEHQIVGFANNPRIGDRMMTHRDLAKQIRNYLNPEDSK